MGTQDRPNVLLVSTNPALVKQLGLQLGRHEQRPQVYAAANSDDALELAEKLHPAIVLISASLEPLDGFETVRRILSRIPGVSALVLADEPRAEDFRRALRAGARDLLTPSASEEEFRASLDAAFDVSKGKKGALAAMKQVAEAPMDSGQTIAVFSTKGGTGKTFLSVNLATGLAAGGKRVALVDLDLQFGDAAIALGLVPERTIFDLVQTYTEYDFALLETFMCRHACGLYLLPAPLYPDQSEEIRPADISSILRILREHYDYVVVDTPPFFEERILVALDSADYILYVGSMDVPTIKNMKLAFNTFRMMSYPKEKLKVVMNRSDSRVGLEMNDVEKQLGAKVQHTISSSIDVTRALNAGEILVTTNPHGKVGTELLKVIASFQPEPERSNGKKPGLFFRRSSGGGK